MKLVEIILVVAIIAVISAIAFSASLDGSYSQSKEIESLPGQVKSISQGGKYTTALMEDGSVWTRHTYGSWKKINE